jgi:hypothetical protein
MEKFLAKMAKVRMWKFLAKMEKLIVLVPSLHGYTVGRSASFRTGSHSKELIDE